MTYIFIYLSGCFANLFMILIHYIFGFFTIGYTTKNNLKKIGYHISFLGGRKEFETSSIRNVILDTIFSWLSFVVNIFTLLIRITHYFKNLLTSPEEIKKISYLLSSTELSPEEVLILELKIKNNVITSKISTNDFIEIIEHLKLAKNINLDKDRLLKLAKENSLLL